MSMSVRLSAAAAAALPNRSAFSHLFRLSSRTRGINNTLRCSRGRGGDDDDDDDVRLLLNFRDAKAAEKKKMSRGEGEEIPGARK